MKLSINFANKVGPYDMFLNKCAPGRFCHVEISTTIDTNVFRVMVDNVYDQAYSKEMMDTLLQRTKDISDKTLHVCFYIMWGGVVSIRFLCTLSDDALMRPPEKPVYDTVVIPMDIDKLEQVVSYNLRQLGREYDIPRAVLLLSHFTLRTLGPPEKFFCSQLVMHTFLECEIYLESIRSLKDINHMTPTGVYDWLVKQQSSSVAKEDEDQDVISKEKE